MTYTWRMPSNTFDADLGIYLSKMKHIFMTDPTKAIRGQNFIKTLHVFLENELRSRLSKAAVKRGVQVGGEITVLGSYKTKDVDVAVYDPKSGPLVLVGVRSQMSSIGKNVLTYYQDIAGEAVSLQERFPLTTLGYVYLHPLRDMVSDTVQMTNYQRWSALYASISGRDDRLYKHIRGMYDQFSYMLVDFDKDTPEVRDDLIREAVPDMDLSIRTFVDRIVETTKRRMIWYDLFD